MHSLNRTFAECTAHRSRLFAIRRVVTLGHTNAMGGAYFAAYFAWTGEAREELLLGVQLPKNLVLHTSEAHMKYLRELAPFDALELFVWPRLQRRAVSLRFFFLRADQLIAVGDQLFCFTSGGVVTDVPDEFIQRLKHADPGSTA